MKFNQCDTLMYAVASTDSLYGEVQKTPGTFISQTGVCVYVQTPMMREKLERGQAKHV